MLVYLPTLRYQLVWDDIDIIVQNRSSPLEAFSHSFWHGGGAGVLGKDPYYRPLTNLSLGVDEAVAGHHAWYFHMVNALLHAAAVALAVVVVWRVFSSFWPALVGGVVCAVHPLAADSVAYVSGRTDLLAGIGLLVALLGLLRLDERHDLVATALVWAGFAFGIFAKETAAVFPVVAVAWLSAPGLKRVRRQDWIALAGVFVLLGAYLASRCAVLGSVAGVSAGSSVSAYSVLSMNSFGRLLLAGVLPWGQKVFLWSQAGHGRLTLFAVPTIMYLALPFARPMRRSRPAWLAWSWALAFLLPFAGLAAFGPAGRLLYVPGMGFVLLALLAARGETRGRTRGGRVSMVAVAFGYCALLALFALPQRMRVWKDGHTLFRHMTKEVPQYPAAHFNYAFELRQRGDLDGAVAEYRRAIALDPGMALAYSNLGALLQSKGELAEAESLYLRTIDLRPGYALAWNNLAIVRYKRRDGAGAVQAFRKAIALKPDDAGAIYNLGRVYQQSGIADSAASMFERAYRLEPDNPQIRASYEQTHGQP